MTKADKGAGVVIKEANRQLSEKVSYKQLIQDATL